MNVSEKSVEASGHKISYTRIDVGSNAVCFMFSGIGYLYDKPLLYYATMKMLEHGIDVIHVHYHFKKKLLKKSFAKKCQDMMNVIQPVLDAVLADQAYVRCLFLGKSIGTIPIAGALVNQEKFNDAPIILLTPLITYDEVFMNLLECRHQGLLAIGDKDRFYDADRVKQLKRTHLTIEVIHNADHSLNVGTFDTAVSITALARVMRSLDAVIQKFKLQG